MASIPRSCNLCSNACTLEPGEVGRCHSRANTKNFVGPAGYGRITSLALDPIEKKPFARYYPGSTILSAGSYGCNMSCPWCQNASISCAGADNVDWTYLGPQELVDKAVAQRQSGCIGVALTYNEPLINWEYARDVGFRAIEAELVMALVTNGQASEPIIRALIPVTDAVNVDLKGFTQELYDRAGGSLELAKQAIEVFKRSGVHVEVTTLVIPGLNDSEGEIDAAARWLAELDRTIPYHLTRFFPQHRMADAAPTPVDDLRRLADVAKRHLDDVLIGNV